MSIVVVLFIAIALFSTLHSTQTQAEKNTRAIKQIQAVLVTEKVCSASHAGEACRALFDRLAISLTKQQKVRLVCDGLFALGVQGAERWRRQARCPPPLPSPP